jgi:hypothetical protein
MKVIIVAMVGFSVAGAALEVVLEPRGEVVVMKRQVSQVRQVRQVRQS